MNFFERILNFLDVQMIKPLPYGWFHLMMFAIMIALSIFLVIKYRNASDKTVKKILLTFSIIMLTLEVYKQLYFSYNGATDAWNYQWYVFPFQFCSVPMYVMLIAGLVKKDKVENILYSFLGTYTLFAGIAVMLYPNDVFLSTVGINIQTMIHHGFMMVIGIYMLASKRVPLNIKSVLKASIVFSIIVLMAVIMNYTAHFAGLETEFNMFFVSPYFGTHLPVLSLIYPLVPYVVYLFIYTFGFTLVSYIVILIAKLFSILYRKTYALIKR